MQKKTILFIVVLGLFFLILHTQYAKNNSSHKRWLIGNDSTLLNNLVQENSLNFTQQFNLNYQIAGKEIIPLEPKPSIQDFVKKNGENFNNKFQMFNTFLRHNIMPSKDNFYIKSSMPIIHHPITHNYLIVLNN